MATKPESRLQRRIRQRLEQEFPRSYWRKIHGGPFQQAGLADLIGCVGGLFFSFEVKRPGQEPSEIQEIEMEHVRNAGGVAAVIETPEEAVTIVRKVLEKFSL